MSGQDEEVGDEEAVGEDVVGEDTVDEPVEDENMEEPVWAVDDEPTPPDQFDLAKLFAGPNDFQNVSLQELIKDSFGFHFE